MAELFLPVLSHFQNNNPWSASAGRMRYRILPDTEREVLSVEIWEGPWAYEFSQVETTGEFPLSQEGLSALPDWLAQRQKEVDARPERTLEENIARRKDSSGKARRPLN